MYKWNKFQEAIFSFVENTNTNLVIEALAGTGKTATVIEVARRLNNKNLIFVAFNRDAVNEIKDRNPRLNARTLHSIGFSAINFHMKPKPRMVDESVDKQRILITMAINKYKKKNDIFFQEIFEDEYEAITRLVSLGKNTLRRDKSSLHDMALKFGLYPNNKNLPKLCGLVEEILELCRKETTSIDFDDMIWFPAMYDLQPLSFKTVIVDEAQDLNECQLDLIHKMVGDGGRLIAVGDKHQSIYSWRGATEGMLDKIQHEFNCERLSLPVTQRCGKSIADLARTVVAEFESADHLVDGTVRYVKPALLLPQPPDFVLSRTNAGLIPIFLELQKAHIPVQIAGSDQCETIKKIIRRSKANSIEELRDWIENRLVAIANYNPAYREGMEDRLMSLDGFAREARSIEELRTLVNKAFMRKRMTKRKQNLDVVTLSTVHKAKGLERDRVWVLKKTFKTIKSEEEKNLWYVAITRAKRELCIVE